MAFGTGHRMHDPALAALTRGALVVTPNKRLARDLVARFDVAQRARARAAWPAARAMPWHAFVGDLWQQALDAGLDLPPLRLEPAQAALLWQRIVEQDVRAALVDGASAAVLVAEAWERVQAYGEGDSWRGFASGSPEVDAFVRWAAGFVRETQRRGALDPARAPDAIAAVAAALPGVQRLDIACAGFVEMSPQQRRMLAALAKAGARVDLLDAGAPVAVTRGRLVAAATPRDELVAALSWARRRAEADPHASVGIVIHDLHQRRALVQALAEDVLCPGLQWPGREHAPRPYDISAGGALAEVPLVAAALDLVALGHGPLDRARVASLLRSRYLPGDAAARARRAGLERGWLEQGRREFLFPAIAQAVARVDDELAQRWRRVRGALPSRGSPRDFVEAWRSWLQATGWGEGIDLDAAEHAARGAWNDLLADFVRLAAVAPTLDRASALRALREAAQAKPFEPEAPGARIRILGVLEAAGLAFDAVWIAGLSAEAWPRAPEPNPLLPIAWQRDRDVPRATPARELAYARALTARLDAAAPEVRFSYAVTVDDHASVPSPLISHLPRDEQAIARPPSSSRTLFGTAVLERRQDADAPAWAEGAPFRGGAGLIEAQSACPFQATGRFRLRAEGWPDAYAGLKPTERGKFVHAAFAAFWREVRDQRTLKGLDEASLAAHLARAVAAGRAAVDPVAWDALPPVVAAVEVGHVERLMRQWLQQVDAARPSFAVEDVERDVTLTLAGHAMKLRIDRIDRLDDGRRVILDYKTGLATAADHWFAERPQAPQLPLYAMALDDGVAVAALAYAQLKPGQVKPVGLADDAATWPGLPAPAGLRRVAVADWDEAQARMREAMSALAQAVHEGDARVLPRDPKVCTRCELKALCRKAAGDEGDESEGDPE